MEEKELILEVMRKAGEPLNAGKVAELTGLDRKVVDKAFAAMKKEGSIVSPVRCKWEPAEKGCGKGGRFSLAFHRTKRAVPLVGFWRRIVGSAKARNYP